MLDFGRKYANLHQNEIFRDANEPEREADSSFQYNDSVVLFGSSIHIPNVVFAFAVVIYTGKRPALCVPTTNLSMLFSDKHNNNVRYTYIHCFHSLYKRIACSINQRNCILFHYFICELDKCIHLQRVCFCIKFINLILFSWFGWDFKYWMQAKTIQIQIKMVNCGHHSIRKISS